MTSDALQLFHPATQEWFRAVFAEPTPPQRLGWPAIAQGESALIFAPTGSGKTLAAFLWCIDRIMFGPPPSKERRCRVVYVSPLKALAVDIERNLRAPLAGIANVAGARDDAFLTPAVAVRTGDTPQRERARFQREPADLLITTPESLYLLLTSSARDALRHVDTIVIDEIHALVPTKRGSHLALSVERLELLTGRALQRIGLSATQRPLEEVARFLGGAEPGHGDRDGARANGGEAAQQIHDEFDEAGPAVRYRPVTIVQAPSTRALSLTIEVPVEDMSELGKPVDFTSGPASQAGAKTTIWSAIHPRLLALVKSHRSTLMFVNGRRLAERLAAALNELAAEALVSAHHGSIAREQRVEIEDNLKSGRLAGLVATSSLELGIDMGAVDLVVQIEAPPSVASGLQRIGRSGHQVGGTSRGILFPKYRGDLVACAAVTRAMRDGRVEATKYPRNPLDVLAQQIVAMVAMDPYDVDALYDAVRRAAPFARLSRGIFEGVLDMLSGRYPSDDFAELRPRVTWDRVANTVSPREGAKRVAIVSGGTIPDRGLYGVFLAGHEHGSARVGELDEEMVFESRVGETFVLGATTWRIEEITHDRVLVSPAPGEPGKMPFWKGDRVGRPLELGREIGGLVRSLVRTPPAAAIERLIREHDLEPRAAENLLAYLAAQLDSAGAVPDDRTLLVERYRDELGDWRVCLLSPFGGQVLAPWALAVVAKVREELGLDVETLSTDDGFVVRFPDFDEPPEARLMLPEPAEAEALVFRQLGSSALFAARFRECAGRALLLPKRRPGSRSPLWQVRKRAADLLAVAARYGSFPIVLEAYRECLRDVFDMPALIDTLRQIETRDLRVVVVDSTTPTPFAASLLFGYVANYIYDGDAPLAERRAQALAIDQSQLRELIGDVELRELLDPQAMADVERELQGLADVSRVKSADGLHDLLLRLGDLSTSGIDERMAPGTADAARTALARARRALSARLGGETRWIAVEDAARYRDGLGMPLPPGLPDALLAPVADPARDLVRRYARTHGPFTTGEVAVRFGLARALAESTLSHLHAGGNLVEGAFRPGGTSREWCDPGVLSAIRRRSLARIRHEVEPVEPRVLGRLVTTWQGVLRKRGGLDALLDVIENLQGAALPASILESELLPARILEYQPADLDTLVAAGEAGWVGVEPLGDRDGRVALYLTDALPRLWRARQAADPGGPLPEREARILEALGRQGALFFSPLHAAAGGGYPGETVDALWGLVWRGLVTNDSLHALRSFVHPAERPRVRDTRGHAFRSRRAAPPEGAGRWSLVADRIGAAISPTEWCTAVAQQLLSRYGLVTRETLGAEAVPGGFSALYDVLRTMEERGRIRRGFFVAGVGATQFALPAALDLLRSLRTPAEQAEAVLLSATDPANPYGTILKWPRGEGDLASRGPTRSVGASVVIVDGDLAGYLSRGHRQLLTFLPENDPERSRTATALSEMLASVAASGEGRKGGLLVSEIDAVPAFTHPLASFLEGAGFVRSAMGFQIVRKGSRA